MRSIDQSTKPVPFAVVVLCCAVLWRVLFVFLASLTTKESRSPLPGAGAFVSRRAFVRLLRELLPSGDDSCGVSFRFTGAAVYALQEACEAFLVHLLAEAYIASLHVRRVTLKVQ